MSAGLWGLPLAAQEPLRALSAGPLDAQPAPERTIRPLWASTSSAAVPGLGQWALGQRRSWIYLGAEVATWWLFLDARSRGRQGRRDYRDLAWEVARGASTPRTDGDFDYYERMSKFVRSGAFDRDPSTPGIQPEADVGTYNGSVWVLAQGIFLGPGTPDPASPGYQRALEYYAERAYGDAFVWDWTDRSAEQERFRSLIRRSDDAFRTASTAVGLVLTNHLISSVDALLSARLPGMEVRGSLVPGFRTGTRALQWGVYWSLP
ncbi:MAG: hypothetical protein R3E10_02510 [Gemmatimonadota bacterium]